MDHPCKGMTKVQIATFEQLAVGCKPPAKKATWDALEARGVIERGPDMVRRDAIGQFNIPQWQVPIHIHMQWCGWCSENVADKEPKA